MIEDTLVKIKNYCDENNILVFEGFKDEESMMSSIYTFDNKKENDWKAFFIYVLRLGVKIVVLENKYNKIETLLNQVKRYREINDLGCNVEEFTIDNNFDIDDVIKLDGLIYQSLISFTHDNCCYQLTLNSSWIKEYESFESDLKDELYILINGKSPLNIQNEKKILSDETIDEVLKEFFSIKKEIFDERDDKERQRILFNFLNEKFDNDINQSSLNVASKKAKKIYDNELKNKVIELKSKGLKNVEVCRKLGISDKVLNKIDF